MHKYFDFHASTATSSVLPTFVNLTYVESRLATRFEMQVLQWVVVLLNCLLIIFPYIWTFLMGGSQVRSHRQHLCAQGKISNDYLPPMLLWLFLGITLMKPKRLKVYARSGLISTKLPIVKDLIEIITHIQMYQNNMKMVLDRYTAIQEGFGVKPRHM